MIDKSQYTMTLISGNQVMIKRVDGHINIKPNIHAKHYKTAFSNKEKRGERYVFPDAYMPFIPDKLDCGLFNISKLVSDGYTDDKMDYIPVLIMCNDIIAQGRVNFALENKVIHKREFSSIHTVSVKVAKTDIPSFINVFFNLKENRPKGNTLLKEDVAQIKLDEMISIMN
ncbi:MAG TPA: hypothetical protein VK142_10210 [Bacillota bacterium]|nr:hypothetical protein [Bacillota bacterium]